MMEQQRTDCFTVRPCRFVVRSLRKKFVRVRDDLLSGSFAEDGRECRQREDEGEGEPQSR
jgi:hypothetical protein